jgi:hypothetical protein
LQQKAARDRKFIQQKVGSAAPPAEPASLHFTSFHEVSSFLMGRMIGGWHAENG